MGYKELNLVCIIYWIWNNLVGLSKKWKFTSYNQAYPI